jgi:O-antigen/teichoic acid export membrane protein
MIFSRLAKDSAIYGGADFIGKTLTFFSFPLVAAVLSPLAFGALELILVSGRLLGVVVNCGLNNALQRFYWDENTLKGDRPSAVSSGFMAQFFFGSIAFMLLCIFIPELHAIAQCEELPISKTALFLGICLMVLFQWNQYALDVTRLHEAPWCFFSISIFSRGGAAVLGVLAVVVFEWGIDGWIGAQVLALLSALPVALCVIRHDLTVRFDFSWVRKLTGFGYPFIFVGLAYWLFTSMDRWMLAGMASVNEVGIYSVASRFGIAVFFVSTAFGQAWSPLAIKIRTEHPKEYREIYVNVLFALLLLMLAVGGGLALFSGEVIGLFMPATYGSAALPLAILCFGSVLQSTLQVTAIGISLEKKVFLFARVAWVTALINLGLNYFLIPKYGATGAATATLASYMVMTGCYLYFTQRLHPLPIPWWRLGSILSLGVILACVAISWVSGEFVWFAVISKIILVIVCIGLAYFLLPFRALSFRQTVG